VKNAAPGFFTARSSFLTPNFATYQIVYIFRPKKVVKRGMPEDQFIVNRKYNLIEKLYLSQS
jgi:hypothetical protein